MKKINYQIMVNISMNSDLSRATQRRKGLHAFETHGARHLSLLRRTSRRRLPTVSTDPEERAQGGEGGRNAG